ncbi:MAG: class I SAM-dependent methyltransferase [Deltaproteobacteria bacterium]|nr:class I SAM-dependent methyltransferase [Deltaproteobacteria bacterium]
MMLQPIRDDLSISHDAADYWRGIAAGRAPRVSDVHQAGAPELLQRLAAVGLRAGALDRLHTATNGARLSSVLDAACGTGNWSLALAPIATRVVGFDINASFVRAAASAASARGFTNTTFVTAELTDLDRFATDGPFDLILFGSIFSCVDTSTVNRVLSAARRLLSPRGVIYVRASITNRRYEQTLADHYFSIYRRTERYQSIFNKSGFRVVGPWRSEQLIIEGFARFVAAGASTVGSYVSRTLIRIASHVQRSTNPVGFANWFLIPTLQRPR